MLTVCNGIEPDWIKLIVLHGLLGNTDLVVHEQVKEFFSVDEGDRRSAGFEGCGFSATREAAGGNDRASDGIEAVERTAQLVEHGAADCPPMTLYLDDFTYRRNAELDLTDDVDAFVTGG